MHGTMLNRRGRKRKSGRRSPSGQLIREYVDFAKMAGEQPHRRDLPLEVRLSQDATTELGRLYLRKKITEPQYLAGQELVRRVGAYHAIIGGPRAIGGPSRWAGCNPELCEGECDCVRRTKNYQEFHEIIAKKGRRVEMAIKHIVIFDNPAGAFEYHALCIGLSALANHMRLTERGKSR